MKKILTVLLAGSFLLLPNQPIFADTDVKVSGWIPYWKTSEGISDANDHLDKIDIIHPFSYSVQDDGSIKDLANMESRSWRRFIRAARSDGVEVVPTVMWSNGGAMQEILSDEKLREEHVQKVVDLIEDMNFDGVDIDYEAKRSETKDFYSMFLKELKKELGSKLLTCTVEARTPLDSLYATVPTVIEYANDYVAIGKYCDVIEIMAYDQGRADIKLNKENMGKPYSPVSDVDWVEKVLKLSIDQGLPKEKIMLAAPTYGYEYTVSVMPQQFADYKRQWSLSQNYGVDTAEEHNITPERSGAGELSYSYFPDDSPYKIINTLSDLDDVSSAEQAAAKALIFANVSGWTIPVNYVTWSDAGAIKEKFDLAEKYGLRGVSLFKIDGGEDQDVWDLID
jgi:spore germination protein YaaH